MEKVYRISLLYVFGISLIILVLLVMPYIREKKEQKPIDEYVEQDLSDSDNDIASQNAVPISNQDIIITENTKLSYIDTYINGSIKTTDATLPSEMVGIDRNALNTLLDRELQEQDEVNQLKRLYEYRILRFSSSEIVIERIYQSEKADYFYLGIVDDCVVVFCEDKETIYLNTGIPAQELPDAICMEIQQFKLIQSIEELFDFLEAYTS